MRNYHDEHLTTVTIWPKPTLNARGEHLRWSFSCPCFFICIEVAITCFLSYNLHDRTFNERYIWKYNVQEKYMFISVRKSDSFFTSLYQFFRRFGSSRPDVFCKKNNFIKMETLTQAFYCEFFQISKNSFCYRTPPMAPS